MASACTAGAAVAGNAFIGKAAMDWFRGLTAPRWQLPLPAFMVVGGAYYGIIGYVLARSIDRRDARSTAWSMAVLVGNEAWNGAFFGRRSPRAGLLSLGGFLIPLIALQRSVAEDAHSRHALAPYTAYVLIYDLPWIYRLCQLNPTGPAGRVAPRSGSRSRRTSAVGAARSAGETISALKSSDDPPAPPRQLRRPSGRLWGRLPDAEGFLRRSH
jgi:tryptophan-rich sensory protein